MNKVPPNFYELKTLFESRTLWEACRGKKQLL